MEKSYQQTLDFEKLSFLYFVTGNQKNLTKMLSIAANKRHNTHAQFYNSLLIGDVEARVQVLEQAGQLQLAYMTATTHGLDDLAKAIADRLQQEHDRVLQSQGLEPEPLEFPVPLGQAKLFQPPVPLQRFDAASASWPHTRASRSPFDSVIQATAANGGAQGGGATSGARLAAAAADEEAAEGGAWGGDELELSDNEEEKDFHDAHEGDKEEANEKTSGWGNEELDLEELEELAPSQSATVISLPPAGTARPEQWARNSMHAADLVAAGQFDVALKLLNDQIGLVNSAPLKAQVVQIYRSRTALLPCNGGLPPIRSFLDRTSGDSSRDSFPRIALTLQAQIDKLGLAYKAFTAGSFTEALELFRSILHSIPLLVVTSRTVPLRHHNLSIPPLPLSAPFRDHTTSYLHYPLPQHSSLIITSYCSPYYRQSRKNTFSKTAFLKFNIAIPTITFYLFRLPS